MFPPAGAWGRPAPAPARAAAGRGGLPVLRRYYTDSCNCTDRECTVPGYSTYRGTGLVPTGRAPPRGRGAASGAALSRVRAGTRQRWQRGSAS